jgi:hypothetical protein
MGDGGESMCLRACLWAQVRGGSRDALGGIEDGVGSEEPPEELEGGGIVGGWDMEAAHLVMVAIRSTRTLLWILLADWGDTWSSPLLSVVTLGSITVAGGVGGEGGAGGRFSIRVSSRTLTRLLMVSRIFLTLHGT